MRAFRILMKVIKIIKGYLMKDLVWYACYGSNLYRKRFLYYIQGGGPEGATELYRGCSNKSVPRDDKTITIPYQLYFSKRSSRWENRGVAFVKSERNESYETLGRMYLIKKDQFVEIVRQESGRDPDDASVKIDLKTVISEESSLVPGITWYGRILNLGSERSYPILTCTATWVDEEIELNRPGKEYLEFIIKGVKETYQYQDERIIEYLTNIDGIKGRIDDQEITTLATLTLCRFSQIRTTHDIS